MINFLRLANLLFLFVKSSSERCLDDSSVVYTGETYESSGTGYRYGVIHTPNFPAPFKTPFKKRYIIDASHQSDDSQSHIHVYLTQMYLNNGVKFFQRSSLCTAGNKTIIQRKCGKDIDQKHPNMLFKTLHHVVVVTTSCPFLEIEVNVPELYGSYHYRTRDPFLFDIYGFNITYEVVPEHQKPKNDPCTPSNCSSLGHCYLSSNWREFYCACAKNHPGKYCQYSPQCDPDHNVTFCKNGGKCRIFGSGTGFCDCTGTGYNGSKCEKKIELPIVSASTGCSSSSEECAREVIKRHCSLEASKKPCSCRPLPRSRRVIPDDWVKLEASLSLNKNFTMPRAHQDKLANQLRDTLNAWFRSKQFSDLGNVTVTFHRESDEYPKKVLIHISGSKNSRNIDAVRDYLLLSESTSWFREELRVQKHSYEVHHMPRLQFKSLEVSKKPRMKMGTTVSHTCSAMTGPSKYYSQKDIRFRWFKDGLPINTSIAARHMRFKYNHFNNETVSILLIDVVSSYDGGLYTCEITDMEFGDQVCGEQEAEIILPPQIEIEPMSLTLVKESRRDIVITCTDGRDTTYDPHNKTVEFEWAKGGSKIQNHLNTGVFVEDIIPQGKILRIVSAETPENYTCIGNNTEGEIRSKILDVRVLNSRNAASCKEQWEPLLKPTPKEKKLMWEWTAPSSTAMVRCPKGFIGYVKRECRSKDTGIAEWGRSDFSFCLHERLKGINLTLQNAKNGFGDWQQSSTVKLMLQLGKYLDSNQVLYPGEGEKIIGIMDDILKYDLNKGKVSGNMFNVFLETALKLLKTPNSCVQGKSVLLLNRMIADMAVHGAMQRSENDKQPPKPYTSEILLLQTVPIKMDNRVKKIHVFPPKETLTDASLSWLRNNLSVIFPLDSEGFKNGISSGMMMHYHVFAAYKNISSLLTITDDPIPPSPHHGGRTFRTSIELISPIVQLAVHDYDRFYLSKGSYIKISFNLSREHSSLLTHYGTVSSGQEIPPLKGTYLTCGGLDNPSSSTKPDNRRLAWTMNSCSMAIQHKSYVECQCDHLGAYGLLKVSNIEEEMPEITDDIPRVIIAGFAFCVLSCTITAAFLCVYIKCQIFSNSLYTLKLLNTFFILMAVVIILVEEAQTPPASRLVWSAIVCSLLISSLSVQMTKSLRILLMEVTPNRPAFIFPWLKNVSQLILLAAITFSTTLPVWTATLYATLVKNMDTNFDYPPESAFHESSPVFPIFGGTVLIVVLISFVVFYKAVLKTNQDLSDIKEKGIPPPYASDLEWVLEYRLKTLYRSLAQTAMLLILNLAVVLYENRQSSVLYQSLLGLSTTTMGLLLFFSYVVFSEYPIYVSVCKPDKYVGADPEINGFKEGKANQRKLFPSLNGGPWNGSATIVTTTGLLPAHPQSILRNGNRPFGEESETLSVSTVEEQSMDTFSTEMSFMTTVPPVPNKVPLTKTRTNSIRSNGSNAKSSNGSNGRSSRRISYSSKGGGPQPIRGCCLISSGDYIMPSVRNNTTTERPSVDTENSATSTTTYNNYLPITDQDEIQKKISHDLSILLPSQQT